MLICLNGPPRAGKTWIADYLVEYWGFTKLNLARSFKSFIAESLNVSVDTLEDIKDQVFHPDNSHNSLIASPIVRDMCKAEEITVRELFIDAANLIERVDPAAWVRRAMSGVDVSNDLYVLDSIGKVSQWAWIVANTNTMDIDLWRVGANSADFKAVQFPDGRHGIGKDTLNSTHLYRQIINMPKNVQWCESGETERQIIETLIELGAAN